MVRFSLFKPAGKIALVAHVIVVALVTIAPSCKPRTHNTTRLADDQILKLMTASMDDLLGRVRSHAEAIQSVNAVTTLDPSTGSSYSGIIKDYRDVRAFVLATRETGETHLRMIGQAPIVRKTVFDMVADRAGFQISIPPKHKFIVGTNRVEHRSDKPIENLRPHHLFDAFLPVAPAAPGPLVQHYLEENEFGGRRYYVISEAAGIEDGNGAATWHMARKWWFDRTNLTLVRAQQFDTEGRLVTDIRYEDWRAVGDISYPYSIEIVRPHDDYQLKLLVKELKLNEGLAADKFALRKPPKAELVNLDELAARQEQDESEAADTPPAAPPEGP